MGKVGIEELIDAAVTSKTGPPGQGSGPQGAERTRALVNGAFMVPYGKGWIPSSG